MQIKQPHILHTRLSNILCKPYPPPSLTVVTLLQKGKTAEGRLARKNDNEYGGDIFCTCAWKKQTSFHKSWTCGGSLKTVFCALDVPLHPCVKYTQLIENLIYLSFFLTHFETKLLEVGFESLFGEWSYFALYSLPSRWSSSRMKRREGRIADVSHQCSSSCRSAFQNHLFCQRRLKYDQRCSTNLLLLSFLLENIVNIGCKIQQLLPVLINDFRWNDTAFYWTTSFFHNLLQQLSFSFANQTDWPVRENDEFNLKIMF